MSHPLRIAILGASGYTGAELLRLLPQHPHARITALTGESQAGKPLAAVYPHLAPLGLPDLVTLDAVDYTSIDIVFCCLPHGTTQQVIAALPQHVRVIDLSADFRLRDVARYEEWYGHPHQAPDLQQEAVYGLSELAPAAIRGARLIANPGCYPTSAQLPLIPLLEAGLIAAEGIVIDAKSGVTGAGRSAKQHLLFSELEGGISAYGVGHHRHAPEIEQGLSDAARAPVQVRFTPHLMPMSRGILSTIYVTLAPHATPESLRACLRARYRDAPFVSVVDSAPSTHQVRGSNHCLMAVFADRSPGQAILISVIDNLVKGASGQAVQNMNLMFGFPETLGLTHTAFFP